MKSRKERREERKRPNHKIRSLEAKTENQRDYIRSIVENDIINIEVYKDSLFKSVVTGTKSNEVYNLYLEELDLLAKKQNVLKTDLSKAGISRDTDAINQAKKALSEFNNERNRRSYEFVKKHNDNFFVLTILETLALTNFVQLNIVLFVIKLSFITSCGFINVPFHVQVQLKLVIYVHSLTVKLKSESHSNTLVQEFDKVIQLDVSLVKSNDQSILYDK